MAVVCVCVCGGSGNDIPKLQRVENRRKVPSAIQYDYGDRVGREDNEAKGAHTHEEEEEEEEIDRVGKRREQIHLLLAVP